MEQNRKCKCCGKLTINKNDLFAVCDNCGWERDTIQEENANYKGGANKMSLNEAKKAYKIGKKIE